MAFVVNVTAPNFEICHLPETLKQLLIEPRIKHYAAWKRDGYLILPNFNISASDMGVRTRTLELFASISASPELQQSAAAAANGDAAKAPLRWITRGTIKPVVDVQFEVHTDTYHPNAKAFYFHDDVTVTDGPFHFTPGSHINDERKLRLLYDLTSPPAAPLTNCPSPRCRPPPSPLAARGGGRRSLEATTEATPGADHAADQAAANRAAADQPTAGTAATSAAPRRNTIADYGLELPRPITVRAGTLLIADTSGLHHRGPSEKGTTRKYAIAKLSASKKADRTKNNDIGPRLWPFRP